MLLKQEFAYLRLDSDRLRKELCLCLRKRN